MKTNPELNIIFTIDEKFIQHFSVTLVSILENNADLKLTFYVIHDIVCQDNLIKVVEFAEEKYNIKINLIQIDPNTFNSFTTNLHYSKAVYFRLLFTEILPDAIDKMLFIDADTVVTGSLRSLADYNFGDLMLLCVNDVQQDHHIKRLHDLGFPISHYFNAGVLLINLKGWRGVGAAKDLMELAETYMSRISWWDQDLLNMYFYGRWDYMDNTFNGIDLKDENQPPPTIIHFSGPFKPWLYRFDPPFKRLYWQYLKLTPFRDVGFPDKNFKNFIKKVYYPFRDTYFPNLKFVNVKSLFKRK